MSRAELELVAQRATIDWCAVMWAHFAATVEMGGLQLLESLLARARQWGGYEVACS